MLGRVLEPELREEPEDDPDHVLFLEEDPREDAGCVEDPEFPDPL